MATNTPTSTLLAQAIQNGTFPDSEELLRSDVSSSIPRFLDSLQASHTELNSSVKNVSDDLGENVDSWILQAEKVQEDIVRCKNEAAQIIQEHEKILALQTARDDARGKLDLLQEEVAFNETLERQIQCISDTFQSLNLLDDDIRQGRYVPATETVLRLRSSIDSISSIQSRSLLYRLESQLSQDLQKILEKHLSDGCRVQVTEHSITIQFAEPEGAALEPTVNSSGHISSDSILMCLEELKVLDEVSNRIVKNILNALLPHVRKRSKSKVSTGKTNGGTLSLQLTREDVDGFGICSTYMTLFHYLNQCTPHRLREKLMSNLASALVPILIVDWFDSTIPVDLGSVRELDGLVIQIRSLATEMELSGVEQSRDLEAWINQLPRTWASRRRMQSLDIVREAFRKSSGSTRQVERVEKQTVVVEPTKSKAGPADDEWAENWDDVEETPTGNSKVEDSTEDGSDAWGFGTDEQEEKVEEQIKAKKSEETEDAGEAWGWEDDDESAAKGAESGQEPKPNGAKDERMQSKEQNIVLTEHYAVTDMPDYILDQISKDIADFQTLQASPSTYFKFSTSTSTGINPQSLPTLILAMFRATAPLLYQTSSLSSMNLYNDILYLTDKVTTLASNTPTLKSSLDNDIATLTKFARTTYTTELTLQRTILYDLLDSAQGFVSCTRPPYAQVCEDAIASVTDYLRSLHKQWQPVLSLSHLRQAIGSLLSGIMAKMITDIEDMEDISEPESQKLVSFCERVTTLQDLFMPDANSLTASTVTSAGGAASLITTTPTTNLHGEKEPASQIALYVPAYLRFAYFQQILGGSLADIRYFWEEGGLSLEFTADEVIDLIEALFAQSVHRKNAIKAIRG